MSTVSPVHMIEPVMEENYLTVLPDKLLSGRSTDDASVADNWPPPSTSAPQTSFLDHFGRLLTQSIKQRPMLFGKPR